MTIALFDTPHEEERTNLFSQIKVTQGFMPHFGESGKKRFTLCGAASMGDSLPPSDNALSLTLLLPKWPIVTHEWRTFFPKSGIASFCTKKGGSGRDNEAT